jgi:hypothetical protein
VKQQHLGTLMTAVAVTFPYSSTADGVNMALDVGLDSPFTTSAIAIGTTVAPSGRAMLPLNVTWK